MRDLDLLDLARSVVPPSFAGGVRRIADPVVEPLWEGLRVVVAASAGQAVMVEAGEPVEAHPEVVEAFAAATDATCDGIVAEAWLTRQVATGDVGVYTGLGTEVPGASAYLGRVLLGSRAVRIRETTERLEAGQAAREIGAEDPVNLVVVDLLWLDGAWLLDVPLQERKRILESVVPTGELVRPGIHVRPPVDTWVGSWRAQGFKGLTYRAANSRYRPGTAAADWATTPMPRR